MKEATGELNMTVITVVAIVAVGAFFYAVIWPRISDSLSKNTRCSDAVCSSCNPRGDDQVCTQCVDSDGEEINGSCTFKGAARQDNN
jgi:hypothetical protein